MTSKKLWKKIIGSCMTCVLLGSSITAVAGPNLATGVPINIYIANTIGTGISQVAVSANTAAVGAGSCATSIACPVILYQLVNGSWIESARLMPASSEVPSSTQGQGFGPSGPFGSGIAISADGSTVFVGDSQAPCTSTPSQECGVVDIYVKPAGGWHDMVPTAQLAIAFSVGSALGGRLLVNGSTLFATGLSNCSPPTQNCASVYVFTMPAGGWTATPPTAILATSGYFGFNAAGALAYDTSTSTLVVCFGASEVDVFKAGSSGFVSGPPQAVLTSSDLGFGNLIGMGDALSISGNVIAAGGPNDSTRAGENGGVVLAWVMPSGGWQTTSTESAVLSPSAQQQALGLGSGVVIDGNTIIASTSKGLLYVYQEPAGGWASMTESNQAPAAFTYGGPLVLDGSFIVEQNTLCLTAQTACTAGFIYGATPPALPPTAVVLAGASINNAQPGNSALPVVLATQPVQATFQVNNISQVGGDNITLSISAPAGTNKYSSNNGACPMSGAVAVCSLGSIAPLSNNTEIVTFNPPAKRSTFTVTGTLSTSNPSWDPLDNSASFQAISDNPPIAQAVADLTAHSGQTLSGTLPATDADNDSLTFTLTGGVSADFGTVNLTQQGQYTYVPPASTSISGVETFTYVVSDGLLSAQGAVRIDLNPPNNNPPHGGGGGGANILTVFLLLMLCSISIIRKSATASNPKRCSGCR